MRESSHVGGNVMSVERDDVKTRSSPGVGFRQGVISEAHLFVLVCSVPLPGTIIPNLTSNTETLKESQ